MTDASKTHPIGTNKARLDVPSKSKTSAPQSTQELRSFLLDQMVRVADGKQEPMEAKAICNYAQQIYNTINMEIRHASSKKTLGDNAISAVSFVSEPSS